MLPTPTRSEAEQDALLLSIYPIATRHARFIADRDDREDVVHDVIADFLVRLRNGTWVDPTNLYAFVRIAVLRFCIDAWRRRASSAENDGRHLQARREDPPTWMSPGEAVELGEINDVQDRALARMPAMLRKAWLLVREGNVSHREVGTILSVSPVSVRTYITRAQQLLREELSRNGLPVAKRATGRKSAPARGRGKRDRLRFEARTPTPEGPQAEGEVDVLLAEATVSNPDRYLR